MEPEGNQSSSSSNPASHSENDKDDEGRVPATLPTIILPPGAEEAVAVTPTTDPLSLDSDVLVLQKFIEESTKGDEMKTPTDKQFIM